MSDNTSVLNTRAWDRRYVWVAVAVAGMLGALLGGTAMITLPLSDAARSWRGLGRRGGGHDHLHLERMEQLAGEILVELDATEEQRVRVTGIVDDVAAELNYLAARHRNNHRALHRALSSETVDREAAEAIRISELALVGEASGILTAALLDAAEALTPQQRRRLAEFADRGLH